VDRRIALGIIIGVAVLGLVFAAFFAGRSKQPHANDAKKTDIPVSATAILTQAKDLEAKGNLLDAQAAYQKVVAEYPNLSDVMTWQRKLEDINMKLLFSPVITPKSIQYEVKPGDTLTRIAKEYKTTVELIKRSNNLSNDNIVPGKSLKVWTAPLSILVYKRQNILILKADEEILKTYIVSTGANNSTPVGTYKIVNKLPNPTWFKAGAVVPPGSADNQLGTRWLGFNLQGYGIHGTIDPQNLGKQVTQGCVRMANPDVEELYAIVPSGTTVTIVD